MEKDMKLFIPSTWLCTPPACAHKKHLHQQQAVHQQWSPLLLTHSNTHTYIHTHTHLLIHTYIIGQGVRE